MSSTQAGAMDNKVPIFVEKTGRVELLDRMEKTDEEWGAVLTRDQFEIARKAETEPAFSAVSIPLPAEQFTFSMKAIELWSLRSFTPRVIQSSLPGIRSMKQKAGSHDAPRRR